MEKYDLIIVEMCIRDRLHVACSQSAFRPAQHAIMDDHITK